MKKISIITPCFNAENYIEETILSVINQRAVLAGSVALEYIICDGRSTDRTVELARELLKTVPDGCAYRLISEPDAGMYDALSKGLKIASGEITAYINAGDLYHPGAFGVVADIFTLELAQWITGYTVCYNERSQVIEATLPYRYRRGLFECGSYHSGLPNVQQESTFWSSGLNQTIDFERLSQFRYAGDYYLWLQFSKAAELKVVKSHLGGFKYHAGQLSQEIVNEVSAYQLEVEKMTRRPTVAEKAQIKIDRLLWSAPYKLKQKLAGESFIRYDRDLQTWGVEKK